MEGLGRLAHRLTLPPGGATMASMEAIKKGSLGKMPEFSEQEAKDIGSAALWFASLPAGAKALALRGEIKPPAPEAGAPRPEEPL